MNINSIPGANIAASVWTNVTRTLTADPTPYTDITANGVSLGAGLVLDLRPAAGKRRFVTFIATSATMLLGAYDGATFTGIATNTANTIVTHTSNNSTLGMTIKNSSGGALNYWYCGWDRG
jgi:hypothetical protein